MADRLNCATLEICPCEHKWPRLQGLRSARKCKLCHCYQILGVVSKPDAVVLFCLERLRSPATRDDLIKLFRSVVPEVCTCYECGPFMKTDEDGCCTVCGGDLVVISFDLALEIYENELHE